MTDLLVKILELDGPCLTSVLAQKIVEESGISHAAARQRVSRAKKGVNTLAYMPFQRNTRFIYLEKDFGSPRYWDNLIDSLIDSGSAYGLALAALKARDGICPLNNFPAVSGSPKQLKKHLSPGVILERLEQAKLVEVIEVPSVGPCISLIERDYEYYEDKFVGLYARTLTESIVLRAFAVWAKNTGMVSYGKIALRGDSPQPAVASFEWDFSAPSYLGGLSKQLTDKTLPGFVVCDVAIGSAMTEGAVKAFLNKCKTIRNLKNIGNCLQILIASKFEKEAFLLAKKNGVMPVKPETLFGDEVGEALATLSKTLSGASRFIFDPEILAQVYERLSVFEGAVSMIRGAYFEMFVSEIMRRQGYNDVRINEKLKTEDGKEAEIDVIAISNNQEIRFIECKGYSPHAVLPDKEVNTWLSQRVNRAFKYAKKHPDWKHLSIIMELWTTADLSQEAHSLIQAAITKTKPTRYQVKLYERESITKAIGKLGDISLSESFKTVFLNDPLMKARPKIKKLQFEDEIPITDLPF